MWALGGIPPKTHCEPRGTVVALGPIRGLAGLVLSRWLNATRYSQVRNELRPSKLPMRRTTLMKMSWAASSAAEGLPIMRTAML